MPAAHEAAVRRATYLRERYAPPGRDGGFAAWADRTRSSEQRPARERGADDLRRLRPRHRAHRRRIHLAVARALEELYAGRPDENAALLAHHWDLGGEAERAVRWHRRAAEWIAGGNAPGARRHWHRVRELAERIEDPAVAVELGQQSRLMILEYGWRLGMSADEANELLREGEEWARRHDDPRALELRRYFTLQRQGVVRHAPEHLAQASALVGYDVPAAVAGLRGVPHEVPAG